MRPLLRSPKRVVIDTAGKWRELAPPGRRDRVEAGLPARVGRSPLAVQPLLMRHPLERRIQRALLDAQRVFGGLVDSLGDGVAVQGAAAREHLQNQQVERTLKTIVRVLWHITSQLCIAGLS